MSDKSLPVFMQEESTNKILTEAITCIPKNTKIYLIGGALRTAIYYKHFNKKMPMRDYDLFLTGSPKEFISNLRKKGFIYGKLKRKDERVVKKKRFSGAKELEDFVFLDIHFSSDKDIKSNLKKNANFTINGFALPLKEILSSEWQKKIISVKNAEKDLKEKQIRINAFIHPAQLYACVRFVSHGYKPPTKDELDGLLLLLKKLRKNQLERNLKKVFTQTGGEKKARDIVKKMGIKEDIFSFETIKNLRKNK
ncbi:MAG: hypothetical protein WC438_02215 [Candidatus Pacearchaeota archaeon]